jgi:LacI family transcriptional regulator
MDEVIPARGKRATVNDVARLAGVSIATVSKTLNDRGQVRAETRERVKRAAEQLDFVPNPLARGLHEGKTSTVGLLTNDLEGRFSLPILMGAEDAFGADSVSVLLSDARGDAIREQHHLRGLLGRRIDGLIVVGDKTDPRPSLGQNLPVPVVYAYAPSLDPRDTSVISDNVGAGRLAIEHVLVSGRQHIGYVSGDRSYAAARDRVQGVVEVMRQDGLTLVGGDAFYGSWTEEWGRGMARLLLEKDPELDAVLCGSDQIARGVIDALRDLGKDVPGDIAVMGHDNWEPLATQSRPPLSTIDMNLENLGRVAAQLLFRAMDGVAEPGVTALPCRVVTRGSTTPST